MERRVQAISIRCPRHREILHDFLEEFSKTKANLRMADERQRSAKVTISQSIANKCNLVSNIELPAWAGGCQHANTMHTVAVPAMGA